MSKRKLGASREREREGFTDYSQGFKRNGCWSEVSKEEIRSYGRTKTSLGFSKQMLPVAKQEDFSRSCLGIISKTMRLIRVQSYITF